MATSRDGTRPQRSTPVLRRCRAQLDGYDNSRVSTRKMFATPSVSLTGRSHRARTAHRFFFDRDQRPFLFDRSGNRRFIYRIFFFFFFFFSRGRVYHPFVIVCSSVRSSPCSGPRRVPLTREDLSQRWRTERWRVFVARGQRTGCQSCSLRSNNDQRGT